MLQQAPGFDENLALLQVGAVRRYSTEDALEGLLQQVRVDNSLPPTTAFVRLVNLPGNQCALLAQAGDCAAALQTV